MIIDWSEIAKLKKKVARHEKKNRLLMLTLRAQEEFGHELSRAKLDEIYAQLSHDELRASEKVGDFRHDEEAVFSYVRRHPNLLVPLGFDEIRIDPDIARKARETFEDELRRRSSRASGMPAIFRDTIELMYGLRCRDAGSGLWYAFGGFNFTDSTVAFTCVGGGPRKQVTLSEIVQRAEQALSTKPHPACIVLPTCGSRRKRTRS
jgi:hypothetical protein